jgi:hypothetical protein
MNPRINSNKTLLKVIRGFVKAATIKFFPFIIESLKYKGKNALRKKIPCK